MRGKEEKEIHLEDDELEEMIMRNPELVDQIHGDESEQQFWQFYEDDNHHFQQSIKRRAQLHSSLSRLNHFATARPSYALK